MFEQVIIGLVVLLVGSFIVFVFKIRQLYIAVPRLFLKTKLSDNGNIAEINIYNQSKMMEEDIVINLNDELKYEILSTTFDDLELNKNKLSIPRLSPSDRISVLLLIENGNFSKTDIKSILSKTTKGKIINQENLPINYGNLLIILLVIISVTFAPSKLFDLYNNYKLNEAKEEYSFLTDKGFHDYDRYFKSEIIEFYSKTEFPIYQISKMKTKDIISLKYRLINNLATEMDISIYDTIEIEDIKFMSTEYFNKVKSSYYFTLKPKEYRDIEIYMFSPKNSKKNERNIRFVLSALNDYIVFYEKIDIEKIE
ncbi:hypothetical protein [Aliarcobacter butzleri]|uniref:hypothetical protein n=1 Tax=Aliarcobacter butzleri TaxID=28197 RepID=UPI0015870356|nr:hypothetical protein [Aliarcobacter butzleri]NUW29570.1 hypothetical protein [Aliarcobacter butzleri]